MDDTAPLLRGAEPRVVESVGSIWIADSKAQQRQN